MPKKANQTTLTPAQLKHLRDTNAAMKKCATQLDKAVKSKKWAGNLKLTMRSVKAKLGAMPAHFGRGCP